MRRILPSRTVKRPASSKAGGPGSECKKRSPEKLEILEDAWLEALKHLTCPKWSKMRMVSQQLNGLIERNVSRLPMAVIDSVEMKSERRSKIENKIITSDSPISPDKKIQWFKDRGITLYPPADVELNSAIIGFEFKKNYTDLSVRGPAQEEDLTLDEGDLAPEELARAWLDVALIVPNIDVDFNAKRSVDLIVQGDSEQFKARVLFKAEFSPHRNPYSWPAMAYFLKLLYDPSTFVEVLSMYALDTKLKDILFSGEDECYIRCGSFKLQVADRDELCESVSWLEQNVQAEKIEFTGFIDYSESEFCVAVTNYLLGSSWTSANQEVNLGHVNELKDFFRTLIKKFRALSAVQSTFPIITFSGIRYLGSIADGRIKMLLSGKGELEDSEGDDDFEENFEVDDKSEDSGDETKTYIISNEVNRLRIEFVKQPPQVPRVFKCPSCRGGKTSQFNICVTVEPGEKNAVE